MCSKLPHNAVVHNCVLLEKVKTAELGDLSVGEWNAAIQKLVEFGEVEKTGEKRSYAQWIESLVESDYLFHVIFLWLPSPEHAIARVADRVRGGGHHVPDETVRRRYDRGLRNFFDLYQPMATTWRLYDNSRHGLPLLVARGGTSIATRVLNEPTWRRVRRGIQNEA